MVSQNPKHNLPIYMNLEIMLGKTQSMQSFHLVDQHMATRSWRCLGEGLKKNISIREIQFTACNINITKNIQELMNGLKYNQTIAKIELGENELNDEQGQVILNMIKF